MKMDENLLHPFTVARMTDHNVKASDVGDDSDDYDYDEENTNGGSTPVFEYEVAWYDPIGDHTGHYDIDGVSQYHDIIKNRGFYEEKR